MQYSRFVFVHIMKTGGTTFNRIIRSLFSEKGFVFRDKTFRSDRRNEIILFTDKSEKYIPYQLDLGKHKYILGHFTVNKYKHLGWPQITFLRDPVKRVVSYYSVWSHSKLSPKWSIEKFAEKCPNYMHFMTGGNLDEFTFIGICERYEESLQIFEKMFRIKIPDKNLWYNKTPKRKVFTPTAEQIKFVEMCNKLDIQLYNKALKIFDRQVEEYL